MRAWIVVAVMLGGCGGAAASASVAAAVAAPPEAAADPPPEGEVATFVPPGTVVIARFDLAAMRASPNGPGWADLLRVQSAYRTVLEESGIDPIEHLDRALVLAPALYTNETTFVLRHREDAARMRARAIRTGEARGTPVSWREGQGFPIGAWPCRSPVVHEALITAERELVIVPDGGQARALEVARDHRARGGALDPLLEPSPGEIVRFWVSEVPPSVTLATHRIRSADLVVRLLDARTTEVTLDFVMPSDAAAREARRALAEMAGRASSEPMLAGLARILVRVRVEARGDHAVAGATLGEDEVTAGLAALRIAAPLLGM